MTSPHPDRLYRGVVRLFVGAFRLLGLRITVAGAEHLPARGRAVLAANHIGYLDFALLGYAARERHRLVRFMAKHSTFDSRLSGPFMRRMGHIPVDRRSGAAAYRKAERALRAGEIVGVFPEATISRSWTLKAFKPGAVALATATGAPLLPAVTWGGHRVLTVDGRWSLRRRTPVTVRIGSPVPVGDDPAETGIRLRTAMQALLDEVQRDYPAGPRDDADRWWLPHHLGGTAPTPTDAAVLDARALARQHD